MAALSALGCLDCSILIRARSTKQVAQLAVRRVVQGMIGILADKAGQRVAGFVQLLFAKRDVPLQTRGFDQRRAQVVQQRFFQIDRRQLAGLHRVQVIDGRVISSRDPASPEGTGGRARRRAPRRMRI